jgi:hypothetical protein
MIEREIYTMIAIIRLIELRSDGKDLRSINSQSEIKDQLTAAGSCPSE